MRGDMTKLSGLHYIGTGGVPVRDTKTAWVLVAVAAFMPCSAAAVEKLCLRLRRRRYPLRTALAERRLFTVHV
jgi:hypothetical protein